MVHDLFGDQSSLAEFSGYLRNYYVNAERLNVLESLLDGVTGYGHTDLDEFDGSPRRMLGVDGLQLFEHMLASGQMLRLLETTEAASWNTANLSHGATSRMIEALLPAESKPLWVYPHIPKAGGNTFRFLAHQLFGDRLLDVPWPGSALLVTPWRILSARCLTGHGAGALEALGICDRTLKRVVTIRDPLERTVSWWLQDVLPQSGSRVGSAKGLANIFSKWLEVTLETDEALLGTLSNAQSRWLVYPPPANAQGWPWFGDAEPGWPDSDAMEDDLTVKVMDYINDCAYVGLPEDLASIARRIASDEGLAVPAELESRRNVSQHDTVALARNLPTRIREILESINKVDNKLFGEAQRRRGQLID